MLNPNLQTYKKHVHHELWTVVVACCMMRGAKEYIVQTLNPKPSTPRPELSALLRFVLANLNLSI